MITAKVRTDANLNKLVITVAKMRQNYLASCRKYIYLEKLRMVESTFKWIFDYTVISFKTTQMRMEKFCFRVRKNILAIYQS